MENCMNCGTPTPAAALDAKPGPGHFTTEQLQAAADTGKDFNRIECAECFGPNFNPQ